MSFPPNLRESLDHIALIGRYRWSLDPDAAKRRIELAPGTGFKQAGDAIGFELAFGPSTQVIDGKPFEAFAVAPPLLVESLWRPEDLPNVRSIPLVDQQPLREALSLGSESREIGGQLFRRLLDDLDALQPFWDPGFDYELTIAAYLVMRASFERRSRKPDDRMLKSALFQPNVNTRLLAAMREEKDRLGKSVVAFTEALEGVLELDGLGDQAHEIAQDAGADLVALIEVLSGKEERREPVLEALTTGVRPDEKLPPDLDKRWRTFHGHFESVRQVVDCEPLFALMIDWFFGKVAGDGDVAESLYEHLYEAHRDKAILGQVQRDEDQIIAERELDARLQGIFETLQIGETDEQGKLLRAFAQSIMGYVKGVMITVRNPKEAFTKDELVDWLRQQFAALLPYGMDAGEEIMKDLGTMARKLLAAYDKLGSLYGDQLTPEVLRAKAPGEGADGRDVWLDSCKAAEGLTGRALADAFRVEFNTRMSQQIAARFKEWFVAQVGDANQREGEKNEQRGGLTAKVEAVTDQYIRQIDFIARAEGSLRATAVGAAGGVVRRDVKPEPVAAQSADGRLLDAPAGQTLRATAGERTVPPAVLDPAAAPAPAASTPAAPVPAALADGPPSDFTKFTELMMSGAKKGDPLAGVLDASRQSLEQVRKRIVDRLKRGEKELAAARGRWRGLALGEAAIAGDPDRSALGKNHSSLGISLLLEMATHIGAVPGRDGRAAREALASTAQNLECGIKDVPIWEIYRVPAEREEALDRLAVIVKYWQSMAVAVMGCKDYAEDVGDVSDFLRDALDNKIRVTFYNETLADHVRRQQPRDLCFASPVLPDKNRNASVSPPSYVWITNQAAAIEDRDVALGQLAARFTKEVDTYVAGPAGLEMFSYPFIIGERRVGGPRCQLTIESDELPEWSSGALLLVLVNALSPARASREVQLNDGRRVELGRYYLDKALARGVGPIVLQSRILTAALLRHADGKNRALALALGPAVTEQPHSALLKESLSILRSGSTWGIYDAIQPPAAGDLIGWGKKEFKLDLIVDAAAAGLKILA